MRKTMQLKAQIKRLALAGHVPAQAILQNFMLEHFLERISISNYKDMLVLKGGMLIASMVGIDNRTTMDMDATLRGYPLSQETIQTACNDICAIHVDDDVTFLLDRVESIRDDDEYGGYRASVYGKIRNNYYATKDRYHHGRYYYARCNPIYFSVKVPKQVFFDMGIQQRNDPVRKGRDYSAQKCAQYPPKRFL
jgi:hypothetical protein